MRLGHYRPEEKEYLLKTWNIDAEACDLPFFRGDGYRFTFTQWDIFNTVFIGTLMIFGLNACWWVLYHFEFPFIEQYKIDPKTPWPWKKDEGIPQHA